MNENPNEKSAAKNFDHLHGPYPVKRSRPALIRADIPPPPTPPEGSCFAYSHTVEERNERIAIIHVGGPATLGPNRNWKFGPIAGFHAWLISVEGWFEEYKVYSFWLTKKEEDTSLDPNWESGGVECAPNHPIYREGPQVRVGCVPSAPAPEPRGGRPVLPAYPAAPSKCDAVIHKK